MDDKMNAFVLSELTFGARLDILCVKLLPLIGFDRCCELKTLSEYFNVQIKNYLKSSNCVKDIIDVYYKELLYFDIFENAILCEPYIKRELQQCNLEKEEQEDVDNILKEISDNQNNYKIYFMYLSNDVDLDEFESIKIRAMFEYFKEIDKEIEIKLNIGYTLNEMIGREKIYVEKLEALLKIIDSHANDFKDQIIGAMDKIYEGHERILNDLKQFDWNCDMTKLIDCFERHIDVFQLYSEDQRSKKAEVVNTLPESFRDELRIKNINLYMCIQHLMSYSLFFDKLIKLDPTNQISIMELKQKINKVNRSADDRFAVANILRSNVNLDTIGDLLARGKARYIIEDDHELYLFEDALVITQIPNGKTDREFQHVSERIGNNPVVYYKTHIMRKYLTILPSERTTNKLDIKSALCHETNDLCFTIKDGGFKEHILEYARNQNG